MEWTNYLCAGALNRLAECRSTKADLKKLVKARWKWRKAKGENPEPDAVVVEMLEWVGDLNGQWTLTDNLTVDEYNELFSICK